MLVLGTSALHRLFDDFQEESHCGAPPPPSLKLNVLKIFEALLSSLASTLTLTSICISKFAIVFFGRQTSDLEQFIHLLFA